MGYKFYYADPLIEIPELDAFMQELQALGERHGIGFELESGEFSSSLVIVPFSKADWDIFTDSLDDYNGGVPFLDEAKEKCLQARESRRRVDRDAKMARAAQNTAAQEAALKSQGINLSDGHYRLIKDQP